MTPQITVLVVEDETLVRMDISDQLQDFGFAVLEAANAAEAIDLLVAKSDIQVIFTDVDMPGVMDGLMLATAVRDRWPPIKIIVTSGHREVSIRDLPTASCFFEKPYRAEKVAAAMRKMMDGDAIGGPAT